MPREPLPTPEGEDSLVDVVLAYLQAGDAGRAPDPGEVLARHPKLAAELAEFFADGEHLAPLLEPLSCRARPDSPAATWAYAGPDTSEKGPGEAPRGDDPPPEIPARRLRGWAGLVGDRAIEFPEVSQPRRSGARMTHRGGMQPCRAT
jgi:hypothetical protein